MTDLTIGERLLVVETKLAQDVEDGERREKLQAVILEQLKEIQAKQDNVALELAKYRGWVGGAIFIITCLGTFLYKFGGPIVNAITRFKTGT